MHAQLQHSQVPGAGPRSGLRPVACAPTMTRARRYAVSAAAYQQASTEQSGQQAIRRNNLGTRRPRVVLLPVDSSPESSVAVQWAGVHLLNAGDSTHLLQLQTPAQPDRTFDLPGNVAVKAAGVQETDASRLEAASAERSRQLSLTYGPLLNNAQVALHSHAVPYSGPLDKAHKGQAICQQAKELNADLIVLASHQHGGLVEWFKGSVAEYTMKHASCPVAVLHPASGAFATSSAPPAAGAVGRQLVLAVDASEDSVQACQWLLQHLYRTGDVLHVMHVVPCIPLTTPFTGSDLMGSSSLAPLPEVQEYEERMAQAEAEAWNSHEAQQLRQLMEQAGVQYSMNVEVVRTEDPARSIAAAICERAANLNAAAVVLSHHSRSPFMEFFVGSVSGQVTHSCSAPVVVLQAAQGPTVTA